MPESSWTRRKALLTVLAAGGTSGLWPIQAFSQETEGGIGGTGIVGELTGFGSLIVAGARLRQADDTLYSDPFGTLPGSAVKRGHTLTVEAATEALGLVARRVDVTYPLVGQISDISPAAQRLLINGVEVLAETPLPVLAPGDRVAVSGLWNRDRVVASRIEKTNQAVDVLAGDLVPRGLRFEIGGVALRGRVARQAEAGMFGTCFGRFKRETGQFDVDALRLGRFTGAAGALTRLRVEGFLAPTAAAPGFRLDGLGHSFAPGLQLDPFAATRTLFHGAYTGRFAAREAWPLPEDPAARRRILERLSQST